MIILIQKEFTKDDSEKLGLNLLGKLKYNKGIKKLAKGLKKDREKYGSMTPTSVASENNSVFKHHLTEALIGKAESKRKQLGKDVSSNPWNKKGAIPEYVKQLFSKD